MDADTSHWRIEELLGESSWLSALARELVSDRALADDVAQETWVAALRTPPPRATPLRPWLARVARNFAKQRVRGETRRARREVEHARERDDTSPGADELSARLEGQRLLVAALGELNEPYRSTVLLVYFEHQTSAEIAQREGVAASTVRWRLQHALDELRTRLDQHSHGDRRQWALALAPLARSTPGASAAAVPSFFAGVLAMSVIWKLTVAGVAAVLVCAGLTWSGIVDFPFLAAHGNETPPVDVTFAPIEATAPPPEISSDASGNVTIPRESPAPSRATSGSEVRARVRFLDPLGAPVANVLVRSRTDLHADVANGVHARSAPDGRAELVFADVSAVTAAENLRAECAGFALREIPLPPASNALLDLGDVQLDYGGSIAGVVRDVSGAPLANVYVGVTDRGATGFDLELARGSSFRTFGEPFTRSNANGEFTVSGVPVGHRVLSTELPGFLVTFSGSIEVRAGQVSRGVELVLDVIPASEIVDGVVLVPDGTPLPGAHLRWQLGGRFGSNGTQYADEHGRFSFVVRSGNVLDLEAQDMDERFAVARVTGVTGGTRGLELRLGLQRSITLDVRDARGAPVARYRALTAPPEGDFEHVQPHSGPPVELVVPVERFSVVVDADGYERWRSGVLDPATVGATLVVTLDAMPEITGRVRIGESAASGVEISAWSLARTRTSVNGFPSRFDSEPLAGTKSGTDGTFALTVRERATIVVRCQRDGFAPCELGPFEYDPERGLAGLAAQLTSGGAIEGRVLVPAGASTAGKLVAFSRGDAMPFTVRAADDGSFRAEHLAPGRWFVARAESAIEDGYRLTYHAGGDPYREVPNVCTVAEGQTTHFDLPLDERAGGHVIAGTLSIDGVPATGWEAQLLGEHPGARSASQGHVSATGSFTLAVEQPGRALFGLSGLAGPLSGANYLASVEVAGPRTEWSCDLRTATLVVDAPRAGDPTRPWAIVVRVQPGLHAFAQVPLAAGTHTLSVPAGHVKLVLYFELEQYGMDPEKWPARGELTLAAGATGTLKVP